MQARSPSKSNQKIPADQKLPLFSKNKKMRAKVDSRIHGGWKLLVMGSCAGLIKVDPA